MAPKNKKKNGFYFFMRELQEQQARKGCTITLKTLPTYAHPQWKKLSLAEREPYEEMARKYNKDPSLRGGKLASDGTRVEDNLLEEEEKIRLENKMKQDVKRYCNSDCTTEEQFSELAPKKLFYFMSFNMLCVTDEEAYIPVEVGIVEYSIQYGIHREYTKIIYPGHPPTGYAGTAKDKSEQTHQINIFGEDCAEKSVAVVYEEIKSFVCPTGNEEYPPVFSERKELLVTRGCLEWISKKTRQENVFEVWDAALLLLELAAGVGKPFPSYTIASDLLNKTNFDYHPSTRCAFHEEKDNHFCALTYSKKLCYLLSDAVCKLFNVELTEKHIPTRATEEKAYTVHIVKDPRRPFDHNTARFDKPIDYHQDSEKEEIKRTAKVAAPRQPASTCLVEEMHRLRLNTAAATLPGQGIGRGTRRK